LVLVQQPCFTLCAHSLVHSVQDMPVLRVVVLHNIQLLKKLEVKSCRSLKVLCVSRCGQLQQVDVQDLAALAQLVVTECDQLQQVDVRGLAALTQLVVTQCDRLRDLEASGCCKLQVCFHANLPNPAHQLASATSTSDWRLPEVLAGWTACHHPCQRTHPFLALVTHQMKAAHSYAGIAQTALVMSI
jgi:hypothetical protein